MTIKKSSSDISPTKSHTKWPFYVWLDSLITTVSTTSNPEYELCLPLFRGVKPGLIRLSSTWIASLRLDLSFTRLLQTVSTMIVQYTHYIYHL